MAEYKDLPQWWRRVNAGLNMALKDIHKAYNSPYYILGELTSNEIVIGYFVRQPNKSVGFLSRKKTTGTFKPGNRIAKNKRKEIRFDPVPTGHEPPDFETFAHRVLRANVLTLPTRWLNGVIKHRLAGAPVTTQEFKKFSDKAQDLPEEERDFKTFCLWVAVPLAARDNNDLMRMLYHAVMAGGLDALKHQNWVYPKFEEKL